MIHFSKSVATAGPPSPSNKTCLGNPRKTCKSRTRVPLPRVKVLPFHSKSKDKQEGKSVVMLDDEGRCEEVVQLLLEEKGEPLAAAPRDLDNRARPAIAVSISLFVHQQQHRRSLLIPLQNDC